MDTPDKLPKLPKQRQPGTYSQEFVDKVKFFMGQYHVSFEDASKIIRKRSAEARKERVLHKQVQVEKKAQKIQQTWDNPWWDR